jgi:Leucine-rich repeat (LRR) protein
VAAAAAVADDTASAAAVSPTDSTRATLGSSSSNKMLSNVQVLDLAGVDLGRSEHFLKFFDKLFDHYTSLRMLNMSSTRLKQIWSVKWPTTLELIDLSRNQLQEFDCRQMTARFFAKLKLIDLSANTMRSFRSFMTSCMPLFAKVFKISQQFAATSTYSFAVDLSGNLFESLDFLSSNFTTNEQNGLSCEGQKSRLSLRVDNNPLVCDCETNGWWSAMSETATSNVTSFHVRHDFCLSVVDFAGLSCASVSAKQQTSLGLKPLLKPGNEDLWSVQQFSPIRAGQIAARLVCPYRSACSSDSCDCCGFNACDCAFNCPHMCRCVKDFKGSFDLVNCTAANLTQIPLYLPASTTEVLLANNGLRRVQPYQFFGRHRINRLDLARNQIGFVDESGFYGLHELRT